MVKSALDATGSAIFVNTENKGTTKVEKSTLAGPANISAGPGGTCTSKANTPSTDCVA